jgi:hypothetical protein
MKNVTIRLLCCCLLLVPAPAAAQFGVYDALARSFSDVSFSGSVGGLGRSSGVRADRLTSFGIEVLLEIGSVSRATGPATRADSVTLQWRERQVVRSASGVDTVDTYAVATVAAVQPVTQVWLFELGVGYGQTTGFESAVSDLELKGAVRDLPTVSLYASYVPLGTYFALRSGFMRFHALQVIDAQGRSFAGDADAFMAGAGLGQVIRMLNLYFFVEAGYNVRMFPSVQWAGSPPPEAPREITASNWSVGAGIQFSLGRN